MKKDFTSVIIVNYKTKELTRNCVESIQIHFTPLQYEIIIVDNHSQDGSVEYLQRLFPAVTVIASDKNGGFGYANNIGVSRASGEFILLLNSDTIVTKDMALAFVEFYKSHRHLKPGVLGSLLVDQEGNIIHSFGNFLSILKSYRAPKNKVTALKEIQQNYFTPVDIVVGADMFMEKKVFDAMGGFDENIFLYEEELELQYRMAKEGYTSIVLNETGIVHLEGQSSQSWFKRKCSFISLVYVFKKHLPYHRYVFCRIKMVIFAILFFKSTKTTWKEKMEYLKLTVFVK